MDAGMLILTEENDLFQMEDSQQDEHEYMDTSQTQPLETRGNNNNNNNNLEIPTLSPIHSLSTSSPMNNITDYPRMTENKNNYSSRKQDYHSPLANSSHRMPHKRYSPRENDSNVPATRFVHSDDDNNKNPPHYSQPYLIVSTTEKGYTLTSNRIWKSRFRPFSLTQWTTDLLNFIIYNRCKIIYVPNTFTQRRVFNIIAKSVPVCLVPVPPHLSHDSRKMASYIAYLINKHSIYHRNQPFYNSRGVSNRSTHHYTHRPYSNHPNQSIPYRDTRSRMR